MLHAFVKHVAKSIGMPVDRTEAAIGIVLNAADRQGAPIADEIFERVPGARGLSHICVNIVCFGIVGNRF